MHKEALINILMYVFENYIDGNAALLKGDGKVIVSEMLEAGFETEEIDRALTWFGDLNQIQAGVSAESYRRISKNTTRILTPGEAGKLTLAAQRLLLQLELVDILDPVSRELVLDRAMALDAPTVEVTDVKWVTLMVLFNQSEKREQLRLLEDLILFGDNLTEH